MDSKKQIKQAVTISRLYYLDGVTQSQIAKQLNLSRPTVSRALQYARENHIVNIQITDPLTDLAGLSQQLKEKYQLKDAIIATPTGDSTAATLDALGQATATYLPQVVKDNDVLGISWGRTLDAVARHLQPSERQNIQIAYLKGTVANSTHNNYVVEVTRRFNECFHTQAQILPLPVIFENKQVKEMVEQDRFIKDILNTIAQTTVAIFTVGTTDPDATLFNLGYLTPTEIDNLEHHAVGDIISQFVDQEGKVVNQDLTARTMAMPIAHLHDVRDAILVAGGIKKLPAIRAALAGHYATTLVTDSEVAQQLLTDDKK